MTKKKRIKQKHVPVAAVQTHLVIEVDIEDRYSDVLSEVLLEAGAEGLSIDDDETRAIPDEVYTPTGRALLRASFEPEAGKQAQIVSRINAVFQLLQPQPDAKIVWTELENQDWSQKWKEHWKPQRIGERLVIVPSWESFAAHDDDLVITMVPGMAFGTGTHATTRLCAEALERLVQPGQAMLDVGCGSGILALFAIKLGAAPVLGIDNDPDAIMVSRENAEANGLADKIQLAVSADVDVEGVFPLVVANILMKPLLALAPAIVATVQANGVLLLSGLLAEQLDEVSAAYCALGLQESERHLQDEWGLLQFSRA